VRLVVIGASNDKRSVRADDDDCGDEADDDDVFAFRFD
jgi:hypothetical protein